jgi:multidrug efflux system membrane fusion protein
MAVAFRSKIWSVVIVVVLVGVIAATALSRRSTSNAATSAAPAAGERSATGRPVAVIKVTPGHITRDLRTLGTVAPLNQVEIQTRVDGQIAAVLFSEGQRVSAGGELFRIDPRPYQAEVKRALAGVEKNQADLQAATLLMSRLTDLNKRDTGSVPEKDMDAQRALVASLSGALHGAQAQLDSSRLELDYATIRSPINGRVGKRLVDVGNVVRVADGTKLVLITQMHPIAVDFSVPQEQLAEVRALEKQHSVRVDVQARKDDSVLDSGKVTFIGDSIDAKSGAITMRAQFANEEEQLWPGQLVDVKVNLDELSDALVIPQQAIRATGSGPAVFVVDASSHVQLRPVSIGFRSDGRASISRGLSPGETVVVEGVDGLSANASVSPVDYVGSAR